MVSENSVLAFVINMDSATGRWKDMVIELDRVDIPYQRVSGVNGRQLELPIPEFDQYWHRLLTGRRPVLPEIGCYLSHIKALRTFLESDAEFGLILEDDATFATDFKQILVEAEKYAGLWDILRMSSVNTDRTTRLIPLLGKYHLGVSRTRSKGASAYLVNRECATRFINELIPMRLAWDIAFDMEYFMDLKVLTITPFPVRQAGLHETQIQTGVQSSKYSSWRYLSVFPFRAYVESCRFISRSLWIAKIRAMKVLGKT